MVLILFLIFCLYIEIGVAFIADAFIIDLPTFHVLYTAWHAFFKYLFFEQCNSVQTQLQSL